MNNLDKLDDVELMQAEQGVTNAVLYRAYAAEVYAGRLSADESASLDHGFDRHEEAFEALGKVNAARERDRLLAAVRVELTKAIADVDNARLIVQNPYAGRDAFDALNEARGVARGLARAIEAIERDPNTVITT